MAGKVTLLGAGPGDLGLLTLKGYEALQNAEVVVYDRLVGEDILALMPASAEKIDAGKKSANHTIPQEQINEILLQKAQDGKNVVRLKGGDCFLFGRGGEELELLEQNHIPFEVIPGITSALSVPAYAGIPVTHRDFVSSVHIITGHQKKNEPIKFSFENCVKCGGTLVFLMGVSNMKLIMDGLMEHGMRSDMPCAVIEQGTRPQQRKVVATISTLVEKAKEQNIQSPAIIIVGEVCSLSDRFDWFTKLPLKGKEIIVTRPKERMGTLQEGLKKLGTHVISCPCIQTNSLMTDELLEDILRKTINYRWLVFTSPAGVKAFFDKMQEKKLDARRFANNKIAVIGKGTGEELEKYGIFADACPKEYNGRELGKLLTNLVQKDEQVLLLRAKIGAPEIVEELNKAKIAHLDMAIYQTEYVLEQEEAKHIANQIEEGKIDYVTFTSASTVEAFHQAIPTDSRQFVALCIGEKTRQAASKYGYQTIVSQEATIASMIETVTKE